MIKAIYIRRKIMKKLIAIILTLAMVLSFTIAANTDSKKANITDALEILMYLAGLESVYDGTGISPTIEDALGVLVYLAGMVDSVVVPIWAVTELPVATTEPPVTTTELPVTTTEPPVTTTEPPATTTEPPKTIEPNEIPPLEPLSAELEERIKNDYLDFRLPNMGYTIDQIKINIYLGSYNDSVALMISHPGGGAGLRWSDFAAGYEFTRIVPGSRVLVWNDGVFYTLSDYNPSTFWVSDAFGLGLITEQDIGVIWHYFNYYYHGIR
jgi:hypothetical protein